MAVYTKKYFYLWCFVLLFEAATSGTIAPVVSSHSLSVSDFPIQLRFLPVVLGLRDIAG